MKANSQSKLAARIQSDTQRFESLKREIVQLNYFCKGTVLKRMMKCGHKQCACHHDPAKRHGRTSSAPTKSRTRRSTCDSIQK